MAVSMTSAPVLSTPDNHILTEVEPTTVTDSGTVIEEDQFRIRYEIDRTIREVRDHQWRCIALQFPDQMLPHSARVFQLLSRELRPSITTKCESTSDSKGPNTDGKSETPESNDTDLRITILADTSYGSCCVDEIAAEHVDADVIVHYGRACLSPTSRLPVLHVYTSIEIDEEAAAATFSLAWPDKSVQVILTADIPYSSHVGPITQKLRDLGYTNLFAADIQHDPTSLVPNRILPPGVVEDPATLSEWHLFHISQPPTALLLTLSSRVQSIQIYDPAAPEAEMQQVNTGMTLRRRYALVTSMNTVGTWGILINTLSVKNYLHMVARVKEQIAAAGKKSYLFVVGKINAAKVANFAEIGGWVVIGCWESSLIDSRDFFKPILTPFELQLALASDEQRIWTGSWRSDFDAVLGETNLDRQAGEKLDGHDDQQDEAESDEESVPPEFDLRTGKYVSHSRPMARTITTNGTGESASTGGFRALAKRTKGEIVSVNGVTSPAAHFLSKQRTWQGLGSDFDIQYDIEDEVEGATIEPGRSGIAGGYVVDDSEKR